MYARIYDKSNDRYYTSIVYGMMNSGFYRKYIVLNPYNNCFEAVDYLDKNERNTFPYPVLVEIIQTDTDDWICEQNELLKCKLKWKKKINLDSLCGYKDICENVEFLTDLSQKGSVPVDKFAISVRTLADEADWHYILTQKDADDFMDLFAGFHDATLDKLVFEETYGTSKATAVFDNSDCYGTVEICFEKISAIHLRPAEENYMNYILDAALIIKDESVFWSDDCMEAEDLSYDGTYIKALSMKWRKIG